MTFPSVFLSYARGDDGEPFDPATSFAARLHRDLTAIGFDVWFDRVSMPSRHLTFHQEIKDAIRQRDRLVYLAGPRAAVSEYIREEFEFALACDKAVVPILRQGDFDVLPGALRGLPCRDFRDDRQYPAHLAELIDDLKRPLPPMGRLFGVPSLPSHFLSRPDIMRRVKDAVQIDLQKPVVITSATSRVGLQGMGGIGKSVLAAAVARDREIRLSYPDGVIWVSFGQITATEAPTVVAQLMRDVAKHLGDGGLFETVAQGQGVLRELLLHKAVLLVLDDVWRASDLQPFDILGPRCRALVTTRDAGIIHTLHGELCAVELFTQAEALAVLASAVDTTPDALPVEALDVVRECDGLPLAVALCGGMAKKRRGEWLGILQRLRAADLERIADRHAVNEQHRSVYRCMQVSVDALETDDRRRFAELSVFVTDQDVPQAAIATLWAHTANLDRLATEDLLIELSERSLVRLEPTLAADGSPSGPCVALHDLLYDFAQRVAGDPKVLHRALLDAYRLHCPDGWHAGPNDGYFFRNVCQHLAGANGNWDEAADLLCDLRFVSAKCARGLVRDLQDDYREALAAQPGPALEEWNDFVVGEREHLQHFASSLPQITFQQAYNDIYHPRVAAAAKALELHRHGPSGPWFRLHELGYDVSHLYPTISFRKPIAFERQQMFEGIGSVAAITEKRFAVGYGNGWVAICDITTGGRVHYFSAHPGNIFRILPLNDGTFATAGDGGVIRLWDAETGRAAGSLHGVGSRVLSMERWERGLVAGGTDSTVVVWDLSRPDEAPVVGKGHTSSVNGVLVVDATTAISSSLDYTLRVWDLERGHCKAASMPTPHELHDASISPDGDLYSVSSHGRFLHWGSTSEINHLSESNRFQLAPKAVLSGRADGVVWIDADRAVLWSFSSVRFVDVRRETVLQEFPGEECAQMTLVGDGTAVSCHNDGRIRRWDLNTRRASTIAKVKNGCPDLVIPGRAKNVLVGTGYAEEVHLVNLFPAPRTFEGANVIVPLEPEVTAFAKEQLAQWRGSQEYEGLSDTQMLAKLIERYPSIMRRMDAKGQEWMDIFGQRNEILDGDLDIRNRFLYYLDHAIDDGIVWAVMPGVFDWVTQRLPRFEAGSADGTLMWVELMNPRGRPARS